jgi:hypothetical protein
MKLEAEVIIAFDLDNTLCETVDGLYEKSLPIENRIAKVNELYHAGHTILIFTARGSTRKINFSNLTESQLRLWGVRYHELIMGKPNFDLLVDDKAIHSEAFNWSLGIGTADGR